MVIEHTIIEYDSKHVKGVISKITVYAHVYKSVYKLLTYKHQN